MSDKNIDKDIERCKELIKEEHSNWIGLTNQEAIYNVLFNLENYRSDCKKLTCEKEAYKLVCDELNTELQIKNKMIDLMAEYLADMDFDKCCEKIPEPCLGCSWEDYEPHTKCIKEYFRDEVLKGE